VILEPDGGPSAKILVLTRNQVAIGVDYITAVDPG